MQLLSADPSRRASERFVLAYAPVWIGAVALVTLTHALARLGDRGHLALGVGLAAPLWIVPLLLPGADRGKPIGERFSTRYNLLITGFSFLQCYFGSSLFFDSLGMEYSFKVTWIVHRTPLFLYFLTVAYFSLYYVVLAVAERAFRTRFPDAPRALRIAVRLVLCYGVAFAETFSMANPALAEFFRYRDRTFTLEWGSLCYGTLFLVSLPLVDRLERRAPRGIVWDTLAANSLVLVCYAVYGALIAWLRG